MATRAASTPKSAVINPYALAEVVSGRKIDWSKVENKPALLESILQTPYAELFDPQFGGPLYLGLKLDAHNEIQRVRAPLYDVKIQVDVNDLAVPVAELGAVRTLGDLAERFKTEDIAAIPIHKIDLCNNYVISILVRVPEAERLQRLARVFHKGILDTVAPDPKTSGNAQDWTPPDATWADKGDFFEEAAEFFDPVQGAVANCYYIAALSAVAWARPYRVQHMTRATGSTQENFTNMVRFYQPDSGGTVDKDVEVTDSVPVNASSGGFIYARSSEAGEIWPAVYEKAFAKLVTNTMTDHPDITATAWGDCVHATARLTGEGRNYYDTASRSGDQLWDLVRQTSLSRRTFNPMTAWTYSSGAATENKIVYADANIVASHCYTVLGWDYRCGKKYIILRNPWGSTEASVQMLDTTWFAYDISWWRPIDLTVTDGTFGIEASAFKTYYAGLGVVK